MFRQFRDQKSREPPSPWGFYPALEAPTHAARRCTGKATLSLVQCAGVHADSYPSVATRFCRTKAKPSSEDEAQPGHMRTMLRDGEGRTLGSQQLRTGRSGRPVDPSDEQRYARTTSTDCVNVNFRPFGGDDEIFSLRVDIDSNRCDGQSIEYLIMVWLKLRRSNDPNKRAQTLGKACS